MRVLGLGVVFWQRIEVFSGLRDFYFIRMDQKLKSTIVPTARVAREYTCAPLFTVVYCCPGKLIAKCPLMGATNRDKAGGSAAG